jgi:hypothetical protein
MYSSLIEPPVKAKPNVDTDVLYSIHPELLTDAHIYVHCHVPPTTQEILIRIWRTTFVIDRASGEKAALVHAENITYAPVWTLVPQSFNYHFLLIFSALPKSCTKFDLVEEIPQPGGFHIPDIIRNKSYVYHVSVPF